MRWLTAIPFVFAAAQEDDGCWEPIRAASVASAYGSSGFSVQCPSSSGTSFLNKRDGSMKLGRSHSSFLETERASRDPILDFCLLGSASASAMTSEAHVELQLDGAYVVRGADFVPSLTSTYSAPSFFKIDARASADAPMTWFASQSDADSGTAWTKFAMGSSGRLDSDVSGAVIRIGPVVTTESSNNNAFGVELFGCTVASTSLMSFRFKSSRSAIVTRFGKMSSFLSHLTEHVCFVAKLSSSPALCSRIVFVETKEGSDPNPVASASSIAPNSLPYVEITFRILPAGPACSDCRSAETVRAQLQTQLALPTSVEAKTMKAIDLWIEDSDPYTCASKTCPSGTLCVYGRCVTAAEIIAEEAEKDDKDISFSTTIDATLNLSPLNVISGADINSGILTFSKSAPAPGAVLAVSAGGAVSAAAAVEVKTNQSIVHRFLIPIIACSAVAAIILGLLGFKWYQRRSRGVELASQSSTA